MKRESSRNIKCIKFKAFIIFSSARVRNIRSQSLSKLNPKMPPCGMGGLEKERRKALGAVELHLGLI